MTDGSGTPRGVPLLFRTADKIELSFALRVAALATGAEPAIDSDGVTLAQRHIPTDRGHVLPLTFYGRHGTVRTISAARILDGDLAKDDVHDRIVVIGTTVTGGGDVFPTPFDPVMPGAEIVATAIAHLVTGDGIRLDPFTRAIDAVIGVVLTLILVGLATECRRPHSDRRRASGMGRRQFRRFLSRHLAERDTADRSRCATDPVIRRDPALAEPQPGAVFRQDQ